MNFRVAVGTDWVNGFDNEWVVIRTDHDGDHEFEVARFWNEADARDFAAKYAAQIGAGEVDEIDSGMQGA